MSYRDDSRVHPCPRCGGDPAPKRSPTTKNPFMPKSKRLCCSLCGLDYDKGAEPWGSDRPTKPASGSSGGAAT